jgi:hypothetical protein
MKYTDIKVFDISTFYNNNKLNISRTILVQIGVQNGNK